jgi:hypothetical protein
MREFVYGTIDTIQHTRTDATLTPTGETALVRSL